MPATEAVKIMDPEERGFSGEVICISKEANLTARKQLRKRGGWS